MRIGCLDTKIVDRKSSKEFFVNRIDDKPISISAGGKIANRELNFIRYLDISNSRLVLWRESEKFVFRGVYGSCGISDL